MRVLIINKFLYPNGGSETYIFKLGEALEQHGHEVQYFGMEHEGRCVGNRVNAYTSDMDFHGGSKLSNGGKSCMAGFVLKNTLSDNGGVTRGICKMDEQNNLTEVVETKNIVKTEAGAEADGVAVDVNSLVSMNMWGLPCVGQKALHRKKQSHPERKNRQWGSVRGV